MLRRTYVPGSEKDACTCTLPSAGISGATQTGAQGEFAPVRVSSHTLICSGVKVTFPGPRYKNHERWRPTFLPTVTRDGGCVARFGRATLSGFVPDAAVASSRAELRTAAPAKPAPRGFGMPSSLTSVTSVTHS